MGLFSVDTQLYCAIISSDDQSNQNGYVTIYFWFVGELDVSCWTNGVQMVGEILHLALHYQFQDAIDIPFPEFRFTLLWGGNKHASCSNHSMKMLAKTGDTGLPIAVPKFCW